MDGSNLDDNKNSKEPKTKNNKSKKINSIHSKLDPSFLSKITSLYGNSNSSTTSSNKVKPKSKKTYTRVSGTPSFINSDSTGISRNITLDIKKNTPPRNPTPRHPPPRNPTPRHPPPPQLNIITKPLTPTIENKILIKKTPINKTPKQHTYNQSENSYHDLVKHMNPYNKKHNPKQSLYPPYPNYMYYPPIQANKQESTLIRKVELSGVLDYCYKHTELVINKHYTFMKYSVFLMSLIMSTITAFGIGYFIKIN